MLSLFYTWDILLSLSGKSHEIWCQNDHIGVFYVPLLFSCDRSIRQVQKPEPNLTPLMFYGEA